MKNLFVVSFGIFLLVSTVPVQAQPVATHYLGPIFTEMDQKISEAQSAEPSEHSRFVFIEILGRVLSSLFEFSNTQTQVTEAERNLATAVPCFHHDLLIFEEKMAELRTHLRAAFREGRFQDVRKLENLSRWVNARYRHFVQGAQNPTIIDYGYKSAQATDICAFDMRYLPPSEEGYGCTVSVMQNIFDPHPTIQQEIVAVTELMQELQRQQERGSDPVIAQQPFGCIDADTFPKDAIAFARRGHFQVEPDDVGMAQELDTYLFDRGVSREPPNYIKYPSDYPAAERRDAENKEKQRDVFEKAIKYFISAYYKVWNPDHTIRDARIITQTVQEASEIDSVSEPLRKNMKEFAELASDREKGVRLFNTKFAFYLMRSCPFRPCHSHLKRVMNINYTDACFPYADGSYAKDPYHFVTCRESAGVTESL